MRNLLNTVTIIGLIIGLNACGGPSQASGDKGDSIVNQDSQAPAAMGYEPESDGYSDLESRSWVSESNSSFELIFKDKRMQELEDGQLSREGMYRVVTDCSAGTENLEGKFVCRIMGTHTDTWAFELASDYSTLTLTDCKTKEKAVFKEGKRF
jgi:hypothetical protein